MGSLFRILGPLEVEDTPGLGGPKPRALLARLLLDANRIVPYDELVDALWPEEPPARARHTLQVYVSSLRRELGADRIRAERGGYAVRVGPDELDLTQFEALASDGARRLRERDPRGAHERLGEALALWRGPALADVRPALEPERARLEETRLVALENRLEAALAIGRHAQHLPELEAHVRRHPTRERPRRLLMLALYRSGRQADALDAYRDARRTLVEELGLEPGDELRKLEAAILRQDAALDHVPPAPPAARLPAPATPLIGRRRELDEISALLAEGPRLLTLTGPAGTGKTRLALQAAHEVTELFAEGVVFVGLAALRDPELVPAEIAAALDADAHDSSSSLVEQLRPLRLLLVLDNFEQVEDAAAAVAGLLAEAPGLKLLVTSRRPLRVYGEHELPVGPLSLDDEAVPLFLQRARAAGRRLGPDDRVRELCLRLDCLPLAIELASARTREISLDELLETLPRLEAASGGPRDAPDRQRTLSAAISWSYELLTDGERELFEALAVFSRGWDHAAAAAVCEAGADELASLVSHNLVVRENGRYAMLETIREFAAARLEETARAREVVTRHRAHFRALAERGDDALAAGDEPANWLDRLELEHDNLRAAFDRALDADEGEPALRLAVTLGRFWEWRSHVSEGFDRLERALARADRAPADLRARALMRAGVFAHLRGELAAAGERLEAALALARSAGDETVEANTMRNLGALAKDRGDHARARALHEQARELSAKRGDRLGVSSSLINLSDIALSQRDYEGATELARESVLLARELGHKVRELASLINLGLASFNGGSVTEARAAFGTAVRLSHTLRYAECLVVCLEGLAALDADQDDPIRAARFLGASEALRETASYRLEWAERELHERTLAAVRTRVDAADFEVAWRQGRALSFEEAAEQAAAASAGSELGNG